MGPRLASRGNRRRREHTSAGDPASMGPRLASRGNNHPPVDVDYAKMLQWGRGSRAAETTGSSMVPRSCAGFNGAAAREPRKPGSDVRSRLRPKASMGPRLASRGNCDRSTRTMGRKRFNGAAAREPRKRDDPRSAVRHERASMGPRLASRGNNLVDEEIERAAKLQWGRGSRAAETWRRRNF